MNAAKIRNTERVRFPVRLTWQLPTRIEVSDGISHLVVGLQRKPYRLVQAFFDRSKPVTRELLDLEDPLVLRLINANDEEAVIQFIARFGMVHRSPSMSLSELFHLSDRLWALLIRSTAHETMRNVVENANDVLASVVLKPVFEASPKRTQIVLRPDSLLDYMAMEIALAHEVGASVTSCGYCRKALLIGPLTRRRTDAKYCSDRCRVADMRKRNAFRGK